MISRQYRILVLGSVFFLTFQLRVNSQESPQQPVPPWLLDRAVIMDIATIVEEDQEIVWNSENSKVTLPGRPVRLQMVGTNIIISVQFTPYFRRNGNNYLVAQGQVWIQIPNEGMSFYTCMETIPMEFEELIYFFPLGSANAEQDAQIEIQIVLYPFSQELINQPGRR